MEPKTYTDTEVLDITIRMLNNICVPVALKRQIADPIAEAIGNLIVLNQAIQEKAQKENAKENGEENNEEAEELPSIEDIAFEGEDKDA